MIFAPWNMPSLPSPAACPPRLAYLHGRALACVWPWLALTLRLCAREKSRAYIKQNLQPFLVQALAALARKKPDEPLRFLATWLIDNNPNNPKPPADKPIVDTPGDRQDPVDVQILGESKSKIITKDEKPGARA